ncbi:uncharacterized protein L201_002705 [Kwoniella dendrophila CBS 6074]|uniref:Uncharacterized protein n=1 Tax=Kwoniella dendrophila CBS 6074 TaxID=1295534 RepID=A0AAX4JSE4_9TREE
MSSTESQSQPVLTLHGNVLTYHNLRDDEDDNCVFLESAANTASSGLFGTNPGDISITLFLNRNDPIIEDLTLRFQPTVNASRILMTDEETPNYIVQSDDMSQADLTLYNDTLTFGNQTFSYGNTLTKDSGRSPDENDFTNICKGSIGVAYIPYGFSRNMNGTQKEQLAIYRPDDASDPGIYQTAHNFMKYTNKAHQAEIEELSLLVV